MSALDAIAEALAASARLGELRDKEAVHRRKLELSRAFGLVELPSDPDLLARLPPTVGADVKRALRLKPNRSRSGVVPIAVMTSPHGCPHGRCTYCPGGVEQHTAQAYTGREPAARRAARHDFDPYAQTAARLAQLQRNGHPTDKVDLIVMGGTFTARHPAYQRWFVKRCYDALNGEESPSLEAAQVRNETAPARCIGLTLETRPDWLTPRELALGLEVGMTRVELGVQTTSEGILRAVKRGHGVAAVRTATRLAKEAGLKACYHLMPGLPGSTPESDLETFREIFADPDFRPDFLKLYPTLVVPGTALYEAWKRGEYHPLGDEEAIELIARMKALVPPYVRIQRINRDIPVSMVAAGVRRSNLRQLAQERLRSWGMRCQCLRCREIGHREEGKAPPAPEEVVLHTLRYASAGAWEEFLAYETEDRSCVVGYARLRLPFEEPEGAASLRELKVFGQLLPFSVRSEEGWQHRGLGAALLAHCEARAIASGAGLLRVTSGVGARGYYRRFGYAHAGPYMVRELREPDAPAAPSKVEIAASG